MPLQDLKSPCYIRRTKVCTSFVQRLKDDEIMYPKSFAVNHVHELSSLIQNVVGIELVNYSMKTSVMPTFVGRYKSSYSNLFYYDGNRLDGIRNTVPASKLLDIEFADPTGTDTVLVTFDFETDNGFLGIPLSLCGTRYRDTAYLANFIFALYVNIIAVLPAVGSFDPADYDIGGNTSGARFELYMKHKTLPGVYGQARFLFATGPGNQESVYRQLGFDREDTVPDPVHNGIVGKYLPTTEGVFRYADVRVREFPEFSPLARIFGNSALFSAPKNPLPRAVRLLTRPLQRLTTLNIDITLADGMPIPFITSREHQLEFEILSLEPCEKVPSWTKQLLCY